MPLDSSLGDRARFRPPTKKKKKSEDVEPVDTNDQLHMPREILKVSNEVYQMKCLARFLAGSK